MRYIFSFVFVISVMASLAQAGLQSTLPGTIGVNSELTFEVKITKGQISNFSKYQVDVPTGVTISEVDSKGGAFSFGSNRAKIIWVNTPSESEFVIRMKLNSGTASGSGYIHHKYYYLENEARREIELGPVPVVFSGSGTSAATPLTVTAKTETLAGQVKLITSPEKPVAVKPATVVTTTTGSSPKKEITTSSPVSQPKTTAPAGGVVYRVQLSAGAEKPATAKYAGVKDLEVVKEGAMFKVLVGSLASKEEAVSLKNDLAAKGFNGFVVAYQNGERLK